MVVSRFQEILQRLRISQNYKPMSHRPLPRFQSLPSFATFHRPETWNRAWAWKLSEGLPMAKIHEHLALSSKSSTSWPKMRVPTSRLFVPPMGLSCESLRIPPLPVSKSNNTGTASLGILPCPPSWTASSGWQLLYGGPANRIRICALHAAHKIQRRGSTIPVVI